MDVRLKISRLDNKLLHRCAKQPHDNRWVFERRS